MLTTKLNINYITELAPIALLKKVKRVKLTLDNPFNRDLKYGINTNCYIAKRKTYS